MSDGKAGPPLKFITFHCGGCNKTAVLDGRGAAECECVRITQAKEQRMNIDDAVRVVDGVADLARELPGGYQITVASDGVGHTLMLDHTSGKTANVEVLTIVFGHTHDYGFADAWLSLVNLAREREGLGPVAVPANAGRDMPATRRLLNWLAKESSHEDETARNHGYAWSELATLIPRDNLEAALAEWKACS